MARCVWIKDNKDGRKDILSLEGQKEKCIEKKGRKSLDTLAREGQKEKGIEKKGRKSESCTKYFEGEWMKESLEEGRRKIGRNNEGKKVG